MFVERFVHIFWDHQSVKDRFHYRVRNSGTFYLSDDYRSLCFYHSRIQIDFSKWAKSQVYAKWVHLASRPFLLILRFTHCGKGTKQDITKVLPKDRFELCKIRVHIHFAHSSAIARSLVVSCIAVCMRLDHHQKYVGNLDFTSTQVQN